MSDQNNAPSHPNEPNGADRFSGSSQPDPRLAYEPPAAGTVHPMPEPPAYDRPATGGYGTSSARPGPPVSAFPGTVTAEERNWAMAAHLSAFVAAYFALGFLGPLVVLLTVGNRSAFVRRHALEALNFNLTVLIAAIVSGILIIILIGFLMLAAVFLGYVIATIAATMAASRGEDFRYPLTIPFAR
jgi:uncharacterized Tic20 family protein